MNKRIYFTIQAILISIAFSFQAKAQCAWQITLTDSFEYQTSCPDIIAGTTVHTIPQSFAVHSGNYSLYLNFINCNGTSGTCPGDTVYIRHFSVCRNMQYRLSTWLTTSFSGIQCDMRMVVTDGSGAVLNLMPNLLAPYSPTWIQYSSGTVIPTTDDLYFIMITNVGGGGGNDLSMDDFILEQCYPNVLGTSTTGTICPNLQQVNLFGFLPFNSSTAGAWTGPSLLTGGYLGTFITSISLPGSYIYSSPYYGTNPGCPLTNDTVTTAFAAVPSPSLGNDTSICSTLSILLLPGTFPGSTYLWSNGLTVPGIVASTTTLSGDTTIYWVQVTNAAGCSAIDSIQIIFINCNSVNDLNNSNAFSFSPNPSNDFILIKAANNSVDRITIFDDQGKKVKIISNPSDHKIFIGDLKPSSYYISALVNEKVWTKKFIKNQ